MKTLRKGSTFKRVKDTTKADRKALGKLVDSGWSFCDRATWKRECRDKDKNESKTNQHSRVRAAVDVVDWFNLGCDCDQIGVDKIGGAAPQT